MSLGICINAKADSRGTTKFIICGKLLGSYFCSVTSGMEAGGKFVTFCYH